jgi:hypothetical protein
MAFRIVTATLYKHMAIAVMLPLALGACSVGTAHSSNATVNPSEHDVPNGTQLKSILLTSADLPTGFTEDATGTQNSGSALSDGAANVSLTSAGCETILNTIGHTGFGEASYAAAAYTPPSALGEFDETLLEFHRADATVFLGQLRSALGRCTSFKASDASGASENASLSVGAGPKTGDESLSFTVKVGIAGQTMVMSGVAVRLGTAVVVVDNSEIQGSSTALDTASAAAVLVKRLPALR